MVAVVFHKKKLSEEATQEIVKLLRKDAAVDNLSIHNQGITFYIWGKEEVDFRILDELKKKLKTLEYEWFSITAEEYLKTKKGYSYDSQSGSQKP